MKRYSFLLILVFNNFLFAQSISPNVVNTAGTILQNNMAILEWSLGEVSINTLSNSSHILTQGFLQPKLTIVAIQDFNEGGIFLSPNPTSDYIEIQSINFDIVKYTILDISGRSLKSNDFNSRIDLSDLPTGLYILNLMTNNSNKIYSYKLNKI
jgi:hypothetical protein